MAKNQYCTNNDCYKENTKLAGVEYLIVHTPAVYPVIIRALSGAGGGWYTRWNKPGVEKLVHGFIDDTGVYNFAPYTMACWHVGTAWGNAHTVGYELCELDTAEEFGKVWDNAVSHYAELCKTYKLSADRILGHNEAHDKGIASNHSDPEPYFRRFGKSMENFREEVRTRLSGGNAAGSSSTAESGNPGTNTAGTAVPEAAVVKSYDPWAYAKVIGLTAADPRLNVRTAPGAEAPKLAAWPELAAGNEVDVLELYSNGWAKINIQGNRGFVNAVYLDISGDGVIAVRTASVANCTALNVRKTPNGAVLSVLKAGTSVTIIGSGKDPDGDVWYLIKANGAAGYVWPKYIK